MWSFVNSEILTCDWLDDAFKLPYNSIKSKESKHDFTPKFYTSKG